MVKNPGFLEVKRKPMPKTKVKKKPAKKPGSNQQPVPGQIVVTTIVPGPPLK